MHCHLPTGDLTHNTNSQNSFFFIHSRTVHRDIIRDFIYQLMHKRIDLKRTINLHYNTSYMFRCSLTIIRERIIRAC